jgi:hypothetical protein
MPSESHAELRRSERYPATPITFIASGRWYSSGFGEFDQSRVGRTAADAPEIFVGADRLAILSLYLPHRLFVEFEKPRPLRECQTADRTASPLNENNITAVHEFEWRTSDATETRFNRLSAFEYERQVWFGKNGKMQPDVA